jgi:hypothetical protein
MTSPFKKKTKITHKKKNANNKLRRFPQEMEDQGSLAARGQLPRSHLSLADFQEGSRGGGSQIY